MRHASLFLVAAALVGSNVGCNALTGIGDYSTSEDAALDGDGVDGGSNLLDNASFESAACAGWTSDEAELQQVDGVARSGSRSCRVCTLGVTTVFGISQDRGAHDGLVPGTQYVAEAWVRAPDDKPATQNLSAVITLEDADGGLADRREMPGPVTLDATWQHVTTTLTYQADLYFTLEILARSDSGCFLLDDVSLHPAD